jgi:uncharacterized protein YndB with AHSA1/START domain
MANERNHIDKRLDLSLERTIDAPVALVWKVWTEPEHLKKWWTPAPWTTVEVEMDVRPGGIFRFVMRSPEGQSFPHLACFLEVIEHRKIVWTTALEPGYRPAREQPPRKGEDCTDLVITAVLTFSERAGKTHYSAVVLHKDEAERKRHEEMGFHDGWNKCLDQLIEVVSGLKR